jgi:hypothetical protein
MSKALQNRGFDSFNKFSGVHFAYNETWERRDTLFSSPVYENGRFEPYGFLMSLFLDISPVVNEYISSTSQDLISYSLNASNPSAPPLSALSSLNDYNKNKSDVDVDVTTIDHTRNIVIGLHARHRKQNTNDTMFDNSFETGIRTILERERGKGTDRNTKSVKPCSVLIATDRQETLNRLSEFARKSGCSVYSVNKTECGRAGGFNGDFFDPLHHCADGPEHEHGPWAGKSRSSLLKHIFYDHISPFPFTLHTPSLITLSLSLSLSFSPFLCHRSAVNTQ